MWAQTYLYGRKPYASSVCDMYSVSAAAIYAVWGAIQVLYAFAFRSAPSPPPFNGGPGVGLSPRENFGFEDKQ